MLTISLSREYRLLLTGALCPLQPEEIGRLRELCRPSLEPPLDWAVVRSLAERHSLAALLYANLERHAADLVPAGDLEYFKGCAEQNSRHVIGLFAELSRITAALSPAGITICPLKGPLLSQQLYGDAALRRTNDIDLLLDETQLVEAERLLQQAGYRRTSPKIVLTPLRWRFYRSIIHHVTYDHPIRGGQLEIHWVLSTPNLLPRSTTQQFLARAQPLLPNQALVGLAAEDLFCYLILHGARHGWESLKWLVDIVMFLRQSPGPNWQVVYEQMAALDLLYPLGQAMWLAHSLFAAPIPALLQPLLEERAVRRLAEQALEKAIAERGVGKPAGSLQRWHSLRYRSGLKASWRFKLAELSQVLVIDDDWEDLPLPDWLFPLYFVLRPFLWLWRYHLPFSRKIEP